MDIVSSKKRSQMMSSIKHKNTKPELVIRKIIFNLGFRYRLNQKIGNFPGVTVDKKTGSFKYKETKINVVDLPGTYSLAPNSEDERVAKL